MRHRDVRGRGVRHQHRNEERRDAIPRLVRRNRDDGIFDRDDAADPAGNDRARTCAHLGIFRQLRVGDRLAGGNVREVRVAVHTARFAAADQRIRIEVFDLGRDVRMQFRGIVRRNQRYAAAARDEGFPKGIPRVAQRRDRTDPGNDDSPLLQNVRGYDDPAATPCPRTGNRRRQGQ